MFTLYSLKNGLANVQGFYCDGINCGLRPDPSQGDLAFIRSDRLCDIAATYTTNRFQAAPIRHALRHYGKRFQGNFILANAKNANAMTGEAGIADIETILAALPAEAEAQNPVMSSTGVIGYRLPVDKIVKGLDKLDWHAKNSDATARAIMTTDSFKKELCFEVELENDQSFRIAAIAKGAGMINPAMATMLCFIATDAAVPADEMEELLEEAVSLSFNRISVDGDTSTNDTVYLMANGASGAYDREAFAEALRKITFELAMLILKDGEGANKVVAFEVTGAANDEEAAIAATNLSNSLLVKTALFGEDPNWGRIASTIGASGIACDEEKLSIYYDDLLIYNKDNRELDPEREEKAYKIMKKDSFRIRCDLGMGTGSFTSYGCDLSYEYVKINAEYRT
ncbi:bifunctional glutamate N-acetyltransferase/amino-acid acetyltransferase ArgJ [Nitratifractor salsuginis]|uniref:Arginine biosynthesis bifunctional protein ArgJ n=1 Tax=Nitratifractor salsuginis (strain DSM 16511 / JCM 12458 / E9I37-1) TaxID=749222 RepID=E6WYP7_NITSE|nr:bifunctional glutamate N-acetyltransferase/amino-acid acetyltransferase ArgJ [Nitratifractor salsuginis]ADV45418.1 N-acetylglutamate synthase; glutamate N-acetyltransferase [Nitratifractor salsuginis DSM 16511]